MLSFWNFSCWHGILTVFLQSCSCAIFYGYCTHLVQISYTIKSSKTDQLFSKKDYIRVYQAITNKPGKLQNPSVLANPLRFVSFCDRDESRFLWIVSQLRHPSYHEQLTHHKTPGINGRDVSWQAETQQKIQFKLKILNKTNKANVKSI